MDIALLKAHYWSMSAPLLRAIELLGVALMVLAIVLGAIFLMMMFSLMLGKFPPESVANIGITLAGAITSGVASLLIRRFTRKR